MMPGNFLVLNIWVGSLFCVRVSAAFQIYFKCKSNNTNELRVEHFPRPHPPREFWSGSAGRQGLSLKAGGVALAAPHPPPAPCGGRRPADVG